MIVPLKRPQRFAAPLSPMSQIGPTTLPVMPPPMHWTAPAPEPTVPLRLSLPQGVGNVQAQVTQKTADDVIKFAAGGFLVAIGMILIAILTGGLIKPRR